MFSCKSEIGVLTRFIKYGSIVLQQYCWNTDTPAEHSKWIHETSSTLIILITILIRSSVHTYHSSYFEYTWYNIQFLGLYALLHTENTYFNLYKNYLTMNHITEQCYILNRNGVELTTRLVTVDFINKIMCTDKTKLWKNKTSSDQYLLYLLLLYNIRYEVNIHRRVKGQNEINLTLVAIVRYFCLNQVSSKPNNRWEKSQKWAEI